MKSWRLGVVLAFLLCGAFAFADTQTLIDFSALAGDVTVGKDVQDQSTMVDFSDAAGASYTAEEKAQMLSSLAVGDWDVELASSSRTAGNMAFTKTKAVKSTQYGMVLGARIKFPEGAYNSYALIKPPFEIPAYATPTKYVPNATPQVQALTADEINALNQKSNAKKGDPNYVTNNDKFEGKGVLKNVATIKQIKIRAYGSNYPHGFAIRLKDQSGNISDIFIGYLNFDGWKEMVWQNPNYIWDVRNRELRLMPLYPQADPYVKFMGIIVYRDGATIGGDFVTYFKDVELTYDKALITPTRDIDDEAAWGILSQREEARKKAEARRLGNVQVLRFLEQQKQDTTVPQEGTDAAAK
jgi:hypothetical protein